MDLSDPIRGVIPSVDGRVLQVLARAGLPLTGHAVADLAGASPEGTRKVLLRLREHGLVSTQRAGAAVLYEANREHLLWPGVELLVTSGDRAVSSVKQIISTVIDGALPEQDAARVTAALFGSVARRESRIDSDIDVLLLVPDDLDEPVVDGLVTDVIAAVTTATGNDCNVYVAARARFDELVATDDPIVVSWDADAAVFHGPDFRRRLRGGPWDGR